MAKKKETVEIEGLEGEGTETRVYELGFHLDPELPQEEVKKTYQAIHDHIASVGTIVAEGEPTKIPLAYTIYRSETTGRRDFDSAFFCWIAYETTGEGHESIGTMAAEEPKIIRYIDIRTTVEGAKHSAEMQEMFEQAAAMAASKEASEEFEGEEDASPVAAEVEESVV